MSTEFQKEVSQNLGNIPFIYYGSYQIEVHDIYFFTLFYDGILPCIKLSFYDTLNLMKDKAMPLDDSKIKIFLNPRSDQLKEILMQFKITSFSVNNSTYTIEGIIDINLLHVTQYKSYPKMTSHKVLQNIAKEAGLGFNTNIDDTNDIMTWLNPGLYVYDFMEQVLESSYKSDTSFLACYIDYYYNFNVVDIAKELERNIDEQLGVTDVSTSAVFQSKDSEKLVNLLISNDGSMRETNLFFESYRILNNATSVSLQAGYKNIVKYYDEMQKELLIFDIDSITSQNKKSIILKGAPQDDSFLNLNVNTYYLGKIDGDNVHKNYNFSWIQNEKNIFDLEKIGLEVTMRTPNFSIYKFQKIKVFLSNQTATPSADLVNRRLSGDWLITDIKFVFVDKSFKQILKLVKRELELSDSELSEEALLNSSIQGEITTNTEEIIPTTNAIPPVAGVTSSNALITNTTSQLIVDNSNRVDDNSEQIISTLLPELRPLARQLINKVNAVGITIKILNGLLNDNTLHNFGLAFDIGIYEANNYLENSPLYEKIGPIGILLGLAWGGNWTTNRDTKHYELIPNWAKGLSETQMIIQLGIRKQNNQNLL